MLDRYERQLIIKEWSFAFQKYLGEKTVLIEAELPSAAFYLAGVGVGKIGFRGDFNPVLKSQLSAFRPGLFCFSQEYEAGVLTQEDPRVKSWVQVTGEHDQWSVIPRFEIQQPLCGKVACHSLLEAGAFAVSFLIEHWMKAFQES